MGLARQTDSEGAVCPRCGARAIVLRAVDFKTISYQVDRKICTITLNRPHRGNAWTGRMAEEYRRALADADADTNVRAIVITGAGRAFCVGADSAALEKHAEKGSYDSGVRGELAMPGYGVRPEFDYDWAYHFGIGKPIIAAINGPVAGIGLVLACYCDLRFAAAGIKFTTAHGKLNLPAELGLSWLLPRMIGLTRANELLLSSRVFMSEEAEALGLVNKAMPAEELLPYTFKYARELIANVSRSSLRTTKRQIYADLHRGAADSVRESQELINDMVREADYAKGIAALLKKQPPNFD
jgi:enoyl-CoA hydratase/carnithine racemase